MSQLTFPVRADGLSVPGVVGLNDLDAATLVRTGQPIPRPVRVVGLLDTGCTVTAVGPQVFRQLGLAPLIAGSTQTAAGSVPVNLYRVSLSVFGASGAAGPILTVRDILVSELATTLPDVDVLIGLAVLLGCKLLLDGPGQVFTLEF